MLRPALACALVLFLPQVPRAQVAATGPADQAQVGRRAPVPPAPTLDPHAVLTDQPTLQLTGLAPDAVSVEVAAPAGTSLVPVVADVFAVDVALQADRVNRIALVAVGRSGLRSAPRIAEIARDEEAPVLAIEEPLDGAAVLTDAIDLAGRVGDRLAGSLGITLLVDGQPAAVHLGNTGRDGTFLLTDVPLVVTSPPTPTTITVTATDALGNATTTQVVVTRTEDPAGAAVLRPSAGNAQTATVGTELPQPLQVHLVRPDGSDFTGKLVTFELLRGDGGLVDTPGGAGGVSLQAFTDASGVASAWWTLGGDAGEGNQRVRATAVDVAGEAVFHASATPGAPARIHVGRGDGHRAEIGAPAIAPLEAWVSDGRNGVAGVPVTFTVAQGGGLVDGLAAVTVPTDALGRACVSFDLGPEAGTQGVAADFAGNPSALATFSAFGVARGPVGATKLLGAVYDTRYRPVEGARVALSVAGVDLPVVQTDAAGQVAFDVPTSGLARIAVDGSTATAVGGDPLGASYYSTLTRETVLVPGARNAVVRPLLLPTLDAANQVLFDNAADVTLTLPGMTSTAFTVRAGSVTLADGSVPDALTPVLLSVDAVDHDDLSWLQPDGLRTRLAWRIEPPGARFDPPVAVTQPNVDGRAPGAEVGLYALDPTTGRFELDATAAVDHANTRIESDAGSGLATAGLGILGSPRWNAVTGTGTVEIDPAAWLPLGAYFPELLRLLALTGAGCEGFLDGTVAGYAAYSACAADVAAQADVVMQDALGVSGTTTGGSAADLGALTAGAAAELAGLLAQTFGGAAPGVATVELLSQDTYAVSQEVPADLAAWTARVTLAAAPASLAAGDAALLPGPGAAGALTLEVQTVEAPERFVARLTLVASDAPPRASVTLAGRHGLLDDFVSYAIPNVAADGTIVQPVLVAEGEGVRLVAAAAEKPALDPSATPAPAQDEEFQKIAFALAVFFEDLEIVPGGGLKPGELIQFPEPGPKDFLLIRQAGTPVLSAALKSSDPSVASVFAQSLIYEVTAKGPGDCTVTATYKGSTDTVQVEVLAPPLPLTVVGHVQLSDGSPAAGAQVTIFPGNVSVTTDAEGAFTAFGVPSDQGTISAHAFLQVGEESLFAQKVGVFPDPPMVDVGVLELVAANRWKENVSGSFHDPTKWISGSVPGLGEHAVIDQPGPITVTIDQSAEIAALVADNTLEILFGGELKAGSAEVDDLRMRGGTVDDTLLIPRSPGSAVTVEQGSFFDAVRTFVDVAVQGAQTATFRNGLELQATLSTDTTPGFQTNVVFEGAQTLRGQGAFQGLGPGIQNILADGVLTVDEILLGAPPSGELRIGGVSGDDLVVHHGTARADGAGSRLTQRGDWVFGPDAHLVADNGATLNLEGDGVNEGSIQALDNSLLILATDSFENDGQVGLQGSRAELRQDGITPAKLGDFDGDGASDIVVLCLLDNTAQFLDFENYQARIRIQDGEILGGTIDGDDTLHVDPGTSKLTNAIFGSNLLADVKPGATLVADQTTLNGTVSLNATGNASAFVVPGSQTLGGTGEVVLFTDSNFNRVSPANAGDELTIGPNVTVRGKAGQVGIAGADTILLGTVRREGPSIQNLTLAGVLVNQGLVENQGGGFVNADDYTQDGGTTIGGGAKLSASHVTLLGGAFGGFSTVAADLTNDGFFVAPGAGDDALVVDGAFQQTPVGDTLLTIPSTAPGDQQPISATSAVVDGTVTLDLGFIPIPGDFVPLVKTFSTPSGSPTLVVLGGLPPGVAVQPSFEAGGLYASFVDLP